jgi:hypothetical protein
MIRFLVAFGMFGLTQTPFGTALAAGDPAEGAKVFEHAPSATRCDRMRTRLDRASPASLGARPVVWEASPATRPRSPVQASPGTSRPSTPGSPIRPASFHTI